MSKALGALVAVNSQAAFLIMAAFWGIDYLNEEVPLGFSWLYLIVPLTLLAVAHSYYVMIRYLMRVDREMRAASRGEEPPQKKG